MGKGKREEWEGEGKGNRERRKVREREEGKGRTEGAFRQIKPYTVLCHVLVIQFSLQCFVVMIVGLCAD